MTVSHASVGAVLERSIAEGLCESYSGRKLKDVWNEGKHHSSINRTDWNFVTAGQGHLYGSHLIGQFMQSFLSVHQGAEGHSQPPRASCSHPPSPTPTPTTSTASTSSTSRKASASCSPSTTSPSRAAPAVLTMWRYSCSFQQDLTMCLLMWLSFLYWKTLCQQEGVLKSRGCWV